MRTDDFVAFDADGGLIFAARLPGAGDMRLGWGDLAKPSEPPALWVHLDRTKERAQRWIREESGLDPIAAESLLAEETRPGVQAYASGLVVILRGVNMNPGVELDELIVIRLWVEPTRVITLRQYRFQTIAELRMQAMEGSAPSTSGAFLAAVALGLSKRIGPSVTNLEEALDEIEEGMLERDDDDAGTRSMLATIRRQAITYRRYLVPMREALMSLATMDCEMIGAREESVLRVAAEQVTRAAEALEEVRDRAAVTSDELRARREARVGRTVYMLTIVATVALPLGLVTGLMGINVGGMPGVSSPAGFWIVCAVLGVIAVGEVVLFRWMRWL